MPIDRPDPCSPYPPFHPDGTTVRFPAEWLTETVLAVAHGIRTDAAFDRMPILADALEEARCDEPLVLNHCRSCTEHVPECWVIDQILPADELYWAGEVQDRLAHAVAEAARQGHPDYPNVMPVPGPNAPPNEVLAEAERRRERLNRWALRVMWAWLAIGACLILKAIFHL